MVQGPRAYVSHRTAERTRLKVPERRRDVAYFEAARQALAGLDGVRGVEVNPVTASILLHHGGDFSWPTPAAMPFDVALQTAERLPMLAEIRHEFLRASHRLSGWTGGAIDLVSLSFLTLLAVAAVQLLRGNVAAPAITMLWYASEMTRLGGDETKPSAAPASPAA